MGVETVYQEKALADLQSVWRNIFMGRRSRIEWACWTWQPDAPKRRNG